MGDWSGILAVLVSFAMGAVSLICLLVCFIIAMAVKSKKQIPVFHQKSGAFIIGSLFMLLLALILFLGGTDFLSDHDARKIFDEISLFYAGVVLVATVLIIIFRFKAVSKKYYPK